MQTFDLCVEAKVVEFDLTYTYSGFLSLNQPNAPICHSPCIKTRILQTVLILFQHQFIDLSPHPCETSYLVSQIFFLLLLLLPNPELAAW